MACQNSCISSNSITRPILKKAIITIAFFYLSGFYKLLLKCKLLRLLLGLEGDLRRQEAMCLRHCCFSAIDHIIHELLAIGQCLFRAVDIACFFLIDQEQVTAAAAAADVGVLADLDETIRTEN